MQNDKRYWLGGGISACLLIVSTYIVIVGYYSRFLCEYNDMGNRICDGSQVFNTFLNLVNPFSSIEIMGIVILIILIIFIIGSILGYLYGKFKNRKSNTI